MARDRLNVQLPDARSDREGLSDLVYRVVLDALFQGELRAGEVVSEVLLARSLGVSRTPVHAAVRDLVRDGLLVQDGGKRPAVAQITRDDLREIFEMRRLLEGEAAFRAAETMDRQAMQRLEEECVALRGLTGDAEILAAWSAHDDAFHQAIALSCAHGRLASDILRYRRIHSALNSIRMTAELVPQAAAEHGAILQALARRDSEVARRAMNLHLIEWQAYYTNLFSQRRQAGEHQEKGTSDGMLCRPIGPCQAGCRVSVRGAGRSSRHRRPPPARDDGVSRLP